MNPIDHERFSERLSAYVHGTLGPDETEEVRAHLAGCPLCRREESVLIALDAAPGEGLRPDESERLRAAVLAEITAPKPSIVTPSKAAFVEPRRSWAPRIAQFMAAAAVIALAAIYLTNPQVSPLTSGGSDDSGAARVGNEEGAEGGLDAADDGEGGGEEAFDSPEPIEDAEAPAADGGNDGTNATGSRSGSGGAEPTPTAEEERGVIAAQGDGDTTAEMSAKQNRYSIGAAASYQRR